PCWRARSNRNNPSAIDHDNGICGYAALAIDKFAEAISFRRCQQCGGDQNDGAEAEECAVTHRLYNTAHVPVTPQVWTQLYFPFGESLWPLSTLVAAIPVLLLFYLLAGRGAKPHWSALSGAGAAMAIASIVFGMPW